MKNTLKLLVSIVIVLAGITVFATRSTPSATALTNWDPSGQPMPTGDLPGWHQVFADNFANQSYPVGSFTSCKFYDHQACSGTPGVPLSANPDGWVDPSGHCQFAPSKTASIADGMLNIFLHTEGGACLGANFVPVLPPMLYGRYSLRFRADNVPGYKMVATLWPTNNASGEIDFPEGDLPLTMHGALHQTAGGTPWWNFDSTTTFPTWHTATVEWTPTAVTYILDGSILGTFNAPAYPIPQTPMYLSFRGASILGSPTGPSASAAGNVQIDWVTQYSYAPDSPPTTTTTTASPATSSTTTTPATVPQSPQGGGSRGYDLVGSDGGVFDFRGTFRGSLPGLGIHVNNIVGIVATSSNTGYFLVGSDGGVFSFNAPFANSLPGLGVHVDDIVNLVPTLDDRGYFLVARDGGVFSFNAPFLGSLPGEGVHVDDIIGIAATADNRGYWLIGSDGSVYAFGDAHAYGYAPTGAVAITATHDGGGYWVVGSDGSVTAFGDAGDFGDLPNIGVQVNNIVGMVVSPDGRGYNLVGRDGGTFSFGDAVQTGSLPGSGVKVNNIVGAIGN
jgi:Glycosyl hydrolases family 16